MKDYRRFRFVPVLCALAFVFLLSSSKHLYAEEQNAEEQTQTRTSAPAVSDAPMQEYRIQIGDEFDVKSYYNPELNDHVIVRPDGKISLPLINEIVAAGKTPDQLAKELTDRYATEFKQPQVSIILRTFGGQRVYIAGQVNKPGMVTLTGPVTVLQAVSLAEGFNDNARTDQVIVIRRGQENRPVSTVVNLNKAIHGDDPNQDITLMPYDIIYVPRSRIANVNRFIDQFIRKNIPIPFSFSYRLDNKDSTVR